MSNESLKFRLLHDINIYEAMSLHLFLKDCLLFSIHEFSFRSIPYSQLGNIFNAELYGLPKFTSLTVELHRVEVFKIIGPFEPFDISGIANSANLKSVLVWYCPKLPSSGHAPLYGIKDVTIRFCDSIMDIDHLGNHDRLLSGHPKRNFN
jgi:hypothetical protein